MSEVPDPCELCSSLNSKFVSYIKMLEEGKYDAFTQIKDLIYEMREKGQESGLSGAGEKCKDCGNVNIYDSDRLKEAMEPFEFLSLQAGSLEPQQMEEFLDDFVTPAVHDVPEGVDIRTCRRICLPYNQLMQDITSEMLGGADPVQLASKLEKFYTGMITAANLIDAEEARERLQACRRNCPFDYSVYDSERLEQEYADFKASFSEVLKIPAEERKELAKEIAGEAIRSADRLQPGITAEDIIKRGNEIYYPNPPEDRPSGD